MHKIISLCAVLLLLNACEQTDNAPTESHLSKEAPLSPKAPNIKPTQHHFAPLSAFEKTWLEAYFAFNSDAMEWEKAKQIRKDLYAASCKSGVIESCDMEHFAFAPLYKYGE